jgi:hypothetical protein
MMRQLRFIFIAFITSLFVTKIVFPHKAIALLLCGVLSFNSAACYGFLNQGETANAVSPTSKILRNGSPVSSSTDGVPKQEQEVTGLFDLPKIPNISIPGFPGGNLLEQARSAVIKEIGQALNVGSPLLLDQNTAYPDVSDQVKDFRPTKLTITSAEDLQKPLPPGDYSLSVIAYCTEFSIHAPGQGLPYKLAPLKGKQAPAISALLSRGTLQNIPPATLNAQAWRIQSGLPLGKWSKSDRELVRKLIPEYEKGLEGDYLQKIEDTYNQIRLIPGIPSFNELLGAAGTPGKIVLQYRQARQVLADQTIAAERLPDMLFEPTGNGLPRVLPPSKDDSPSRWAEVKPGVFARFTVVGGHLGRNLFEFRVTPKASAAIDNSDTIVAQDRDKSLLFGKAITNAPTLQQILGGDYSPNSPEPQELLLIGYSISRPSQALISVADIVRNTNDLKPQVGDIVIYRDISNAGITHSAVITSVRPDGTVTQVQSKWGTQGLYLHDPDDSIYGKSWTVWRARRKDGSSSNLLRSGRYCPTVIPCVDAYYTDAAIKQDGTLDESDGNAVVWSTMIQMSGLKLDSGEKERVEAYLRTHPNPQLVESPTKNYNCHGFTFTNGKGYIKPQHAQKILDDNGYFQIKASIKLS